MNIIIVIIGIQYVLRGILGVFLRLNYINPLNLKFRSVNFEDAFGTATARGIFIFFGTMLIIFGLII